MNINLPSTDDLRTLLLKLQPRQFTAVYIEAGVPKQTATKIRAGITRQTSLDTARALLKALPRIVPRAGVLELTRSEQRVAPR